MSDHERSGSQRDFVLSGKAIFTVRNAETTRRSTYKVEKQKGKENKEQKSYSVSVLVAQENTKDYVEFGTIKDGTFKYNPGKTDTDKLKFFKLAWDNIDNIENLPKNFEFWRSTKCKNCDRLLTVPKSIKRDLGPGCAKICAQILASSRLAG